MRGDLSASLAPGCLDALVSNPPYLTTDEYATLDPSVRDWEPEVALAAGADGLAADRRGLLDDGRAVLRPGGWLALEIDVSRAAQCAARARRVGWIDVAIHADLFGRERYLLARRSDADVIWDKAQDLGTTDRTVGGVPGAAAGGVHAARRQGHRRQARPDPDAGAAGGSDGLRAARCPIRPPPSRTRRRCAISR